MIEEFKGTPAPWDVQSGEERMGAYLVTNFPARSLAARDFDMQEVEDEANRVLIEAAPKMLEAMWVAINFFEVQADVTDGMVVCTVCKVETDPQEADKSEPMHVVSCPVLMLRRVYRLAVHKEAAP